jgi:hypothetical protein
VLGDLSGGVTGPTYPQYSAQYGGTIYRDATTQALFLVTGDAVSSSGFTYLTAPTSFPSFSLYPAGTWYPADAIIPYVRLVQGDLSGSISSQSYEVEQYSYNLDGYLTDVRIGASSFAYVGGGYTLVPPTSYQLRAKTYYDAMGRSFASEQYDAYGTVVANRTVSYDSKGRVQSESSFVKKADGKTYTNNSSNSYNADGTLNTTDTTSWVDNKYNDRITSRTSNQYLWWDGAVQYQVTYKPDVSKNPSFTSDYDYNVYGHLTHVKVNDGRPRDINFTNDMAGQVLTRVEADNKPAADPSQHYYYFGGKLMGSNGNNGNGRPDFTTALAETTQAPATGNATRAFRAGAQGNGQSGTLTDGSAPNPFADFDQAYEPVSTGSFGGGAQSWTVKQGETLEGIAQNLWGDASLWYMLAQENGIRSSAELRAGQLLQVPNRLANVHNTSDTFRPYDASQAIGDTQPTTPKPPKKPNDDLTKQISAGLNLIISW